MRRALLLVLGVAIAAPVAAATDSPAATDDIAGMYACDGVSPDNHPYHGTVEIVRLDDTFRVIWTLAAESGELQQVMGVGILSNGIFAASYFGGGPGIAVYKIDGRKLIGEWTIGGADGTTYPETLTRMEAGARPFEHDPGRKQDEQPRQRRTPVSYRQASLVSPSPR
jgi:hypothetical protein